MDISIVRALADEIPHASAERLKEWSQADGIFFSYPALIRLKDLINSGKVKIEAEELYFLNGIARSISSSPRYYSAGSLTTSDKAVADTFSDMMSKYAFFYPSYSSPCSLEQAFKLGKKAVEYKKTKSFSTSEISLCSGSSDKTAAINASLMGFDALHTQNGICIAADRYTKKLPSIRVGKKHLISFVCPNENSSIEDLQRFADELPSLKINVSAFADEKYKLFSEICMHSKRLSIIADNLPLSPESQEIISSTTNFLFDNTITIAVISRNNSLSRKSIGDLASRHGLDLFHVIEITNQPYMSITHKGKTLLSLPSDILKKLMLFEALNIDIPNQSITSDLSEVNIYESKEKDELVFMSKISLSDGPCLFSSSINAFASLFISAIYNGKNIKNSEFSLSLNANISSAEVSFAALLGSYRAITEMGVFVENLSISFTDEAPYLAFALKVHSFANASSFETALSPSELYSSLIGENNLPDFSILRDIINGESLKK